MNSIITVEAVLMNYAGPMGKFVLKKKIKEMGLEGKEIPGDQLLEIVRKLLPDAIFDVEMQKKALVDLRKALHTPISYP
ncbi:MAG: hypothetical protein KAT70_06695 [Thermoplasmata archaeon]|nr:hypothetical protein [Thermoplasmata archaeon]